jgi:hypothetical protein
MALARDVDAAARSSFSTHIDLLCAKLMTHRDVCLARANDLTAANQKAVCARVDELEISAAQLRVGASIARCAHGGLTDGTLICMQRIAKLAAEDVAPCMELNRQVLFSGSECSELLPHITLPHITVTVRMHTTS